MLSLWLARHAHTAGTGSQRLWGQSNLLLSPQGRIEAEKLRQRLQNIYIHGIFTSPLRRALATAQTIAVGLDLDPVTWPELAELSFGEWEGLTFEEARKRHPLQARRWGANPIRYAPPGGETMLQLQERVVAAYQRFSSLGEGTFLLVSHAGPIRVLLCHLFAYPLRFWWRWSIDPASLTRVDLFPEGPVLSFLNDTGHLRGNGRGEVRV